MGSDDRFCSQCGAAQARPCPRCGAENPPGNRFCPTCGTALAEDAPTAGAPAPVSERRLVSVLFADLVGFTTVSEHRDPEEVRELLGRYFDRCRTLIERYGGTVEKFIGDAVMAVWGTPVAREDDAERAVRAALALTQMVSGLGEEVGVPELRVRVGVLTGNAAVELGAEGEGMVLGDTVNTASRLQSIAAPGTVLVDDVTRRASEAAVAYEDAGVHPVKGREQPVHAWTALRVVAGAGGARRGAGLEAPFVGRERERELIIDGADESAHDGRACHVAVVGEAGSGKSRLLWEFFKYLDGIQEVRYWHQGRCLSYGEGVAYWALAEMVRARAGIQEEEAPGSARAKLGATVAEFVSDERERRLVEPRLAHLLRLDERSDADRADLFSGWRLFFERMATDAPVVLAFEDLQWADSGLLDFIDYLLEWSAEFPIFVLTLARPESRQHRPGWRPVTLEPLDQQSIAAMMEGLAPGLPEELVAQIVHRAEGIPLYAVETVRMLQDRGVLVQKGARYVVVGQISDLEVPETLQALVASRLDGLSPSERSLLQNASVLGQSFNAAGAAAVSGLPEAEITPVLDGLVEKQILARDDDPRSPERGQYVFIQGLLRTVAYSTLSRRARKTLHVTAAHHLEQSWPGEARDIVEVLASHYQEAINAEPEADDVPLLSASACERLTAAGRAAASLALGPEAECYFEAAAALTTDDSVRAELYEQTGRALQQSGDMDAAERRMRQAMELYRQSGRESGGPAALMLVRMLRIVGRLQESRAVLEAFRTADDVEVDKIMRAQALAELATSLVFSGDAQAAGTMFDEALTSLEEEQSWSALADALVGHAIYLSHRNRHQQSAGVLRLAVALAEEHDLSEVGLRARFNLANSRLRNDELEAAVDEVDQALALARERGDRAWERMLLQQSISPLVVLGRWREAEPLASAMIDDGDDLDAHFAAVFLAQIAAGKGDREMLERCSAVAERDSDTSYLDLRAAKNILHARGALEQGDPKAALRLARGVFEGFPTTAGELIEEAYALGAETTISLGDEATIAELIALVDALPPVRATPLLRAGRARLQAEQAHRRDDPEACARHDNEAVALLRSVGARPLIAMALLERARRDSDAEALAQARAIYEQLGATGWLARIERESEVVA